MKRGIIAASLMLAAAGFGPVVLGQAVAPGGTAVPAGAAGSEAQPMAVLLEQGIYQEETAGKLDAAAKTYGQIAAQAEATRGLAAQALYRLALVQAKQKQIPEAQATVARLAAQYPEQKDLIAKARAAVPVVESVVAASGEAPAHIPTAQEKAKAAALLEQGWQLMQDRKFPEAEGIFRQALKIDPSSAAYNAAGWALLNPEGVSEAAEGYFRNAVALDPKNAAALNGLGTYFKALNDSARAVDFWKAAVEADPTATAAMSGLAKNEAQAGRYDEAVTWYEKWLKVDPQNADAKIGVNKVKQTQAAIKDTMAVVDEFSKKMDAGQYVESYSLMDPSLVRGGFGGGGGGGGYTPRMNPADATDLGQGAAAMPVTAPAVTALAQRWEQSCKIQREPLGKVVSRKVGATSLSAGGNQPNYSMIEDSMSVSAGRGGRGGGGPVSRLTVDSLRQVSVIYTTDFEHQKGVRENIVAAKNSADEWRIFTYTIDASWKGVDPLRAH